MLIRQVTDSTTANSVKKAVLTCLLIRSARPAPAPRSHKITTAAVVAAGYGVIHWHAWTLILHHIH
jgi:hypothetical protein